MVDRSRCIGGETADAIYRDLSHGRAYSHGVGFTGNWSVFELSRRYGVCRDTFYEWRRRRGSGEENWFLDRSHAPLSCPHRTDAAVAEAIAVLRGSGGSFAGHAIQQDDSRTRREAATGLLNRHRQSRGRKSGHEKSSAVGVSWRLFVFIPPVGRSTFCGLACPKGHRV